MMQGNHDASVSALRKSIERNPCFAQAYHGLGMALMLSGEFDEAAQCTGKAVAISPRDPMLWAFTIVHALNCILAGDSESGLEWAEMANQNPNATGYWCPAVKAAALANLDRMEESLPALQEALDAKSDLSIDYLNTNLPTKVPGGLEPYLQGLRRCGLAETA
jgi:adenylate cyclase